MTKFDKIKNFNKEEMINFLYFAVNGYLNLAYSSTERICVTKDAIDSLLSEDCK